MASEKMIDRVAKTICWKRGMDPNVSLGGDGENFLWHEYISEARAVIEAMREPTDDMSFAGCLMLGNDDSSSDAERCWKAMVDEALANHN